VLQRLPQQQPLQGLKQAVDLLQGQSAALLARQSTPPPQLAAVQQQDQQQQQTYFGGSFECEGQTSPVNKARLTGAKLRMSDKQRQQAPASTEQQQQQKQQSFSMLHATAGLQQQQQQQQVLGEPQPLQRASAACLDAEALQQALSAAAAAMAAGNTGAAAAAVAAATGLVKEAAGTSSTPGLELNILGQQQQQQQDEPPPQARLWGMTVGALSSAAPADCMDQGLLAARKERQKALEQHLASRVPLLPQALQQLAAPGTPVVAEAQQQQQQQQQGSQWQVPAVMLAAELPAERCLQGGSLQKAAAAAPAADDEPLVPETDGACAATAGAKAQQLAAAEGTAPAQQVPVDTSAPTQHVALMRLAETAEGRALLDNLKALQLLPADLPQGAQLTLQLVVQPGTAAAAAAGGGEAADAAGVPSSGAAAAAAAAAADCVEPGSPAGSNCSSRSKDLAVDTAGTVAVLATEHSCNAAAFAVAATMPQKAPQVVQKAGQQQCVNMTDAVTHALQQGTFAVGSKRPISAVLPADALTAAVAAAKRVLHNPPPWRASAQ
jgi:hypothetical protein